MPLTAKTKALEPRSLLAWQILAPVAALFFVFLLLGGLAARRYFEPLAKQRDLLRVERYATTAAVVFAERLPAKTPRELSEQFWTAGLDTLEFLPPGQTPKWKSPRFLAAEPFVEAWSTIITSDGSKLGAVRLRRQADATLFVRDAVRHFALTACVTFLMLAILAWILFKRRVTDRLDAIAREISTHKDVRSEGADSVDQLGEKIAQWAAESADKERHLRRFFEGYSELADIATPEGRLVDVNAAYCRFFGKKHEDLIGKNYLDLVHPAHRMEMISQLRSLSRARPEMETVHAFTRPDGGTSWVKSHGVAIHGPDGRTEQIISFRTDITEQKKTEEQLVALQGAFNQMQSLANTGSITWDFVRENIELTPEAKRLLSLETNRPHSLEELLVAVAPDDRESLRRLFLGAREEERTFECEFRVVMPDGSFRILQSRAEVLADPRTKILNQLTCTLRDITALRDAEAATKRELHFREAIEQSLAAGIVVSDEKGKNLMVNPAFCQMTGWSQEELVGITAPHPYWPPEEIPAIGKAFELAISDKTPPEGFELTFCRKDGMRFDVLVKVAPLLDGKDRRLGWLGAVTDISVLQRARRELITINERLQIAQDVVELGIWDWDPSADTLFWDRNSFAMFGHPEATDPKAVWSAVQNEDVRERLTYELRRLIAAGAKSGQDALITRWPDGSVHEILSTYVILRNASGHATRVVGVNRDVTAGLEEERELRHTQERLAAALEGGRFGTFEHIIGVGDLNWSQANYEINGIDPSITQPDALFKAWKKITGDFFPELMAQIDSLPVTQNHHTYEFTALPAGKEPRRVRVSTFIERSEQGHAKRLVGVTRRIDGSFSALP